MHQNLTFLSAHHQKKLLLTVCVQKITRHHQVHNGFNRNPGQRTTLLIDFYKESLYTKDKFEKYYQHYSECFEGLENLVDVYESRKEK